MSVDPQGLIALGLGNADVVTASTVPTPFYAQAQSKAAYSGVATPVLPRDGSHQTDWAVAQDTQGNLDLLMDTSRGIGLCAGHDRLMCRLLRSFLGERGTYMFDLTWGSPVFPGHTMPESIAAGLMSVARAQTKAFQESAPVPGEVMSQVQVQAASPTGDPRAWEATVVIWDQVGGSSSNTLVVRR